MGGNPRSEAASALQSQLDALMNDRRFDISPMSLREMNDIVTKQLIGDRNRALSLSSGLGTARGRSLGLNNPYTLANRMESQIFDRYAGALGGVAAGNIDRSFNQLFQSKGAGWSRLAALLGLKQGNIGNLSQGAWNETWGPIVGGLLEAGGKVGGGFASRV